MGVKVTNNAFGTISAGINTSATTIVLDGGQGARFPTLGSGDFFFATLIDTSNNLEIVKVTARSTDSMTVVRAQDNTTAAAFAIGDRFELRPTAALFNEVITPSELTVTGDLTVDTSTLKVDSANNRVGVGVASPDVLLDVGASDHGSAGNTGIQIQSSQDFSTTYAGNNTNTWPGVQIVNHDDTSNRTAAGVTFVHRSSSSGIAGIQSTSSAADRADLRFITRGSGGIAENMVLDEDGYLLKPNTPGFSCAVGTGHGATGNLTATAVNWGNIYQNFGSHLSGTTFTVPVTGRYFVTFGGIAGQNNTGSAARMQMEVAGSAVSIQARGEEGHSYSQMAASYIIQLTQNDACTVRIHDRGMWTGGQNQTGSNDPHWSMYLLG